jgi:UDP-3-O-[3-hydroxymyristoyl] N-acetylglucosamine deacetylase
MGIRMKQRTLSKSVEIVGVGLHKGVPVKMKLEPLPSNSGIIIYRSDAGITIPLKKEFVVDTKMATVLGKDGVVVSTIEHLLSAIYAYGIDNLRIVLDNDEIPILDGSASGYCMLIEEAGIKEQEESKKVIKIKKEVIVTTEDGKKVSLKPSNRIIYDFEIKFNHPAIGSQKYHFDYSIEEYKDSISKARTFGFLHEVQYLRSIGLALGGSMENAIVLDETKILNPEGLRYDDEFVRHKILDAIGDMALLEYTMIGEYDAIAGSHHLNHLLTKKLYEDKENYEIIDLEEAKHEAEMFELAFAKQLSEN